jgi:antitoxin component of MazEF toxin-antitoxin module
MITHLRKIENDDALVIERPILELLGLDENAAVQLTVEGGALIVTPANPTPVDRQRFNELLDRVVEDRRDVLQRLAQ